MGPVSLPNRAEAIAAATAGDALVVSRQELAYLSTLLHQVSNDLTISCGALTLLAEEAAQDGRPAPELLPAAVQRLDRVVAAVGQLQGGLWHLQHTY